MFSGLKLFGYCGNADGPLRKVIHEMKGKSAIHIARTFIGRERNFTGQHFWARAYFVSTIGKDEKAINEYISMKPTTWATAYLGSKLKRAVAL